MEKPMFQKECTCLYNVHVYIMYNGPCYLIHFDFIFSFYFTMITFTYMDRELGQEIKIEYRLLARVVTRRYM